MPRQWMGPPVGMHEDKAPSQSSRARPLEYRDHQAQAEHAVCGCEGESERSIGQSLPGAAKGLYYAVRQGGNLFKRSSGNAVCDATLIKGSKKGSCMTWKGSRARGKGWTGHGSTWFDTRPRHGRHGETWTRLLGIRNSGGPAALAVGGSEVALWKKGSSKQAK